MITEGNFFVGVLRCIVYLSSADVGKQKGRARTAQLPSILCFMSADDAQKAVPFEKLARRFVSEQVPIRMNVFKPHVSLT